MVKAAIRCAKIKNLGSLTNVERHGRRQDESSQRRADLQKTGNNLSWSSVDDSLAVVDAFRDRKAKTGAKEYGGACIALHTVCIISPEWIAEAGDIHDPRNPRNIQMFREARAWADATYGEGSCISARMDLDEKGGGVVDLVIVPVREMTMRGKTKKIISVNKAVDEAFGKTKSYSAMQDSWSSWCRDKLDHEIQRGVSKEKTQREHVHAEIIGPALRKESEVKKREKAVRSREKRASEIIEKPWWKLSVPSKTKERVLEQAEKNAVYEYYSKQYESIRIQLGDVSSRLTIESRKREKLEAEVRQLQVKNLEMSDQLNQLESVICEAAYEKSIPLKIVEKLRKIFRAAPMLDDVLKVIRPAPLLEQSDRGDGGKPSTQRARATRQP